MNAEVYFHWFDGFSCNSQTVEHAVEAEHIQCSFNVAARNKETRARRY